MSELPTGDFGERHVLTDDSVLQARITVQNDMLEFQYGKCSQCGAKIDPVKVFECSMGGLLDERCVIYYNGRPFCRYHIENEVGDKRMLKVLMCLFFKIEAQSGRKMCAISEKQAIDSLNRLSSQSFIVFKDFALFRTIKITDNGMAAMQAMLTAFNRDSDMVQFLRQLSEVEPDWLVKAGV